MGAMREWSRWGKGRVLADRVLLAGLFLLTASAWLGAGAASADETERANCPPGFVWIRMSGTGCVQETLPEHGKIGYDGHALCVDPYIGIFESRDTTDGQPAPGGPYTSFAYLKRCVTQEQYDAAIAREKEKQGSSSAAMPSGLQAAAAGLTVVAGLVALGGAAVLVNRRRHPTADEIAENDRKLQRQQDLQEQLTVAIEHRDYLRDTLDRLRDRLGTGEWGALDLNSIAGLLASLHSLGGSVGVGIASIVSTLIGEGEAALSSSEVEEKLNALLENLELETGIAEAEVEAFTRDLADLDSQVVPDRLAAESYTDYNVLQEQIDRVNAESLGLLEQRNAHELRQAEIRLQLGDIDNRIYDIKNQLWEVQYGEIDHRGVTHGANITALIAGLVALGPVGAMAVGGAGLVSALASSVGFSEYLIGARVDEVKRLLSSAAQGYQRLRGQMLYQLQDEARRQANAQTLLDGAKSYHDRLREQQAQIALNTNRGELWPKK